MDLNYKKKYIFLYSKINVWNFINKFINNSATLINFEQET